MKTYELTYIISSEISGEEAKVKIEEMNSFIQSKEGVILRADNPIAKTLSYPIKKLGSGYLAVLEFQIEPEKISELKEKLEKDGKILRHVIIIKNPARIRKERGSARKPLFSAETRPAGDKNTAMAESEEKKSSKKVELEDIEKKLDEILGE